MNFESVTEVPFVPALLSLIEKTDIYIYNILTINRRYRANP